MTEENIQRSVGNIEGKLDALIAAIGKSESKAESARHELADRMTRNENRASESRDAVHLRLNTLEHKVEQVRHEGHSTLRKVQAIEPEVESMRKMRTQGIAVAGTLTTLGALFGAALYGSRDFIINSMRSFFGSP